MLRDDPAVTFYAWDMVPGISSDGTRGGGTLCGRQDRARN